MFDPRKLMQAFRARKNDFETYIDAIKGNGPSDLFTFVNATLEKHPYLGRFPLHYFLGSDVRESAGRKILRFFSATLRFYAKNFFLLANYAVARVLFGLFYRKRAPHRDGAVLVDTYLLVDEIIRASEYREKYFDLLLQTCEARGVAFTILPRLYGAHKNPFKLIPLFRILQNDPRDILLEFELIGWFDLFRLGGMIAAYPFKTLRLWQSEAEQTGRLFNRELLNDIAAVQLDVFTRYLIGRQVAVHSSFSKIIGWCEFQGLEKSFNYGLRSRREDLPIYGAQLYLNYPAYLSTDVSDLDFRQKTSPHIVPVNGKYYIRTRKLVQYREGVSLRYGKLFGFKRGPMGEEVLLLASYIRSETANLLESTQELPSVLFKEHPAAGGDTVDRTRYPNIRAVRDDIYELFHQSAIVIGSASGTLVEAVACGVSAIVVASRDNLTANPLVDRGHGEMWEIVYSPDELLPAYRRLRDFREKHPEAIGEIASWYRENFFIKPTEDNIIRAFDIVTEGSG